MFLLLILPHQVVSQNEKMNQMAETLDQLINDYPQTKTYVHTDKPYYAAGEDIWYALYAINANDHLNLPLSKLAYVTLENEEGEVVSSQNLQLDGKFAKGDIKTEGDWKDGRYTLKAYTSYMRNYNEDFIFSKEIVILNSEGKSSDEISMDNESSLNIRFFPEGGNLINGLPCRVAFEVSDTTVHEISIINKQKEVVSTGKTISDGLGYFNLIPDHSETYEVIINNQSFKLPEIKSEGRTLVVNTLNADRVYIDLKSSENLSLEGCFVIGHIRGTSYLVRDQLSGNKMTMALEKEVLPEGVSQITLFNENGQPLAERTFFIRHGEQDIDISTSIPYEYLNKRQKADVEVNVNSKATESVTGAFSVSIVDAKEVTGLQDRIDIRSYLLLGSEFTSEIHDISQYFAENTPQVRLKLDVLMMTKGWTRFKWQNISASQVPEINFVPEKGFAFSGQVLERGRPTKAFVNFSIVNDDLFLASIETEEDGSFNVFGFDLKQKEQLNISAFQKNEKDEQSSDDLSVMLDRYQEDHFSTSNIYTYDGPEKEEMEVYLNSMYEKAMMDSIYDGMSVQLDEVVLSAERNVSRDKKLRKERGIIYTNYNNRMFVDSMPFQRFYTNVFDMVRDQIPGVRIVGTAGQQRFLLRGGSNSIMGSNDALVVVDGVPVTYDYVNTMNVDRIEFIDILKSISSSALYSTPNGVVAIYTRNEIRPSSSYSSSAEHIVNIIHDGYYESREFYSPNYGEVLAGAEKPDLRTTLYWNPRVEIIDGAAKLEFYTADQPTTYTIEIQGITDGGIPFVDYSSFEVR